MDSCMLIDRPAGMRRRSVDATTAAIAVYFAAACLAQTPVTPPAASQPTSSPSIDKRDVPVVTPPTVDKASPNVPKPGESPPTGDTGWLRVTGNSVNIRSRPDVNSLPITRVSKDTLLQAVGKEFGWYAIKPPPGVFSMIAARIQDSTQNKEIITVERQGDTAIIKIEPESKLNVRAGSLVVNPDPEHVDVQTKLKSGERVKVVGEDGDWLKIVPPDAVKVYIKDDFVQRISDAEAASAGAVAGGKLAPVEGSATAPPRPAAGWAAQLKEIENKIETESRRPALEQGWQGLLTELKPVADQREEPLIAGSATRWVDQLQERIRGQDSLRTGSGLTKKDGTELASSVEKPTDATNPANTTTQPAPTGATPPTVITPVQNPEPKPEKLGFDAEGELQATFAVPAGKDGLRYRLIDPSTRATRAYVEFPWELNFKATEHIGRYVGIQGERTVDMQKEVSIWRASKATVLTPDRPVARPRPNP